jgi:hypothetical protein
MRLHRMLERAIDDSPEASREHMRTMGFDCGFDSLAFELVLESLKAECVIQEDEGDLWRQWRTPGSLFNSTQRSRSKRPSWKFSPR